MYMRYLIVVHSLSCVCLWPHELQYARLLCTSLSPGDCSNSCPLGRWCCLESVILSKHLILCYPFSFCLQSFPTLGSFPLSQLFASDGQNTEASASATVLLMNYSGLISFRIDWLVSLLSKGLSRVSSSTKI